MDEYMGIIKLFAGNFAPRGYMLCAGQLLPISAYSALFSIIGTYFGGNGTTNFQLPDLRGRSAVGAGQGPGLSAIVLGELSGAENVALTIANLPQHAHSLTGTVQVGVTRSQANTASPSGNYLAPTSPNNVYNATLTGGETLNGVTNNLVVGVTGSGIPFNNRDPYLGLNYIICVTGIFPSRN